MRYQVAIIDDNESIREATLRCVRSHGLTATAFASAESFLASASFGEVGCLLLDVQMPGVTGPQLQRYLQAQHITVPIIFMTALDDPELKAALVTAGAHAVLQKPVAERDLVDALRAVLP